ncbi:hypothetical protein [Actinomycetospora cinnamomea]|uniref:hypothetical protein n=1 Tax=Actinomycetospora cinnamomea TaxID=663609 RepID=UPI001FAF38B3|nr:hypothetical protein [Actinomycetospora cinnamomea]
MPDTLDLAVEGITAVVWATGYRRRHPWLHLPVLDRDGELVHRGGATAVPRPYAVGRPPVRRRDATLIDGVGEDARHVVEQLVGAARGAVRGRAA